MKHHRVPLIAALTLAASVAVASDNHPTLNDETGDLVIPTVRIGDAPGAAQNAILQMINEDSWQLVYADEGKLIEDVIEDVEAIVVDDAHPIQVLLRVSGAFPTGCGQPGYVGFIVEDNTIDVSAYYENDEWTRNPDEVMCTMAIRPFTYHIPLPVYGLSAGEYTYRLNGEVEGTFTLEVDNVMDADEHPSIIQ